MADVSVLALYPKDAFTRTGSDGSFQLQAGERTLVLISKQHYRPVIKWVDNLQDDLDITMEEAGAAEWKVPACSKHGPTDQTFFQATTLHVPPGTEVKTSRDIDYVEYWVRFPSRAKKEYMRQMVGPMASYGVPGSFWIHPDGEYSAREWSCAIVDGLDISGITHDGRRSRFVGVFTNMIEYKDVSAGAAQFSDKIIDGMCCP
jgi:hypothetical protein